MFETIFLDKRYIFSLDNGYVGSSLENIQVRDSIFLLDGLPFPMALRRQGAEDQYQVVGAVLVNDLMNWEDIKGYSVGSKTIVRLV